jgi:hypothetical protein
LWKKSLDGGSGRKKIPFFKKMPEGDLNKWNHVQSGQEECVRMGWMTAHVLILNTDPRWHLYDAFFKIPFIFITLFMFNVTFISNLTTCLKS